MASRAAQPHPSPDFTPARQPCGIVQCSCGYRTFFDVVSPCRVRVENPVRVATPWHCGTKELSPILSPSRSHNRARTGLPRAKLGALRPHLSSDRAFEGVEAYSAKAGLANSSKVRRVFYRDFSGGQF